MELLKAQLRDAGMGSIAGKLESHLDPEQNKAQLALDFQLGPDKSLRLDLQFKKDALDQYQLKHINSNLLLNRRIVREQHFDLHEWTALKTNQIVNLLEGRAIKQHYADASGHQAQRWVELGPHGIQHYDPAYEFDLISALAGLTGITRNNEELIRQLEGGQQTATHWKQGNKYQNVHLQADPANRRIKLTDEKLRPVTAEKLNQQALMDQSKIKTITKPISAERKGG